MKYVIITLIAAIASVLLSSCMSYTSTNPQTGVKTSLNIVASKAGSLVVNGPMPTIKGQTPIFNKKGVLVGYKNTYAAPDVNAAKAEFAIYDLDQTEGTKAIVGGIKESIWSFILGKVLNNADNNATTIDQDNIAAASKKSSEQAANKALAENNRHTEAMTALAEEPVVTTP